MTLVYVHQVINLLNHFEDAQSFQYERKKKLYFLLDKQAPFSLHVAIYFSPDCHLAVRKIWFSSSLGFSFQ